MRKVLFIILLSIYLFNSVSDAQTPSFRASVEKEIITYRRAFAQRVIFHVNRYFKMRGRVLPEMHIRFRGMLVVRKQLSEETCVYEFYRHHQKLTLAEGDVRTLAGLTPQPIVLMARKPVD